MGEIILLTGPPGSGKTTLIRNIIHRLERSAAGFITREIRTGGIRKGFEIITLDGKHGVLAHIEFPKRVRVGKYGVDLSSLEKLAVKAIREAVAAGWVVVVDEIGPMELASPKFRQAVLEALDSPSTVLATIMKRSHPFADHVKSRPGVMILEVHPENRETLPAQILELLAK